MKKLTLFAACAAIVMALVVLFIPADQVSAKSKMPKNGQKFTSSTFKEYLGKDLKKCYWKVKKTADGKTYTPVGVRKSNGAIVKMYGMYVEIDGKTYFTDEDDASIVWSNPDGYDVSKYGYIIYPKEFPGGRLPKNGETFETQTLSVYLKDDYSYGKWVVEKDGKTTKYRPVAIRKSSGKQVVCSNMYMLVNDDVYYVDDDGYIMFSNPDGYEMTEYGTVLIPGRTCTPPTEESTAQPTTTPSPTETTAPKEPEYTIKKDSYGNMVCVDKNGNYITGFIDDYYFSSWSGMLLGLNYINGDYYYFSEDFYNFGKTVKNAWVNGMYFGPNGKAYRNGRYTIDNKTYYFNDSGFIVTGWVGDDYYSADPDRYGELVPSVRK